MEIVSDTLLEFSGEKKFAIGDYFNFTIAVYFYIFKITTGIIIQVYLMHKKIYF